MDKIKGEKTLAFKALIHLQHMYGVGLYRNLLGSIWHGISLIGSDARCVWNKCHNYLNNQQHNT
jgi:hypothetical protein